MMAVMSLKVDTTQFDAFSRDLKRLKETAVPFAVRNTLNDAAFDTMKRAKADVRNKMINRNSWTVGSIQVAPTKSRDINQMQARVGSTEEYMRRQEFGHTETTKGKYGVSIPTTVASGEGKGVQPRKRVVRMPNRVSSINISKSRATGNRQQRNFRLVKEAKASGQQFIFMDTGRRKGLFKVTGSKRSPVVRMVHDLSHRSVRIPPKPWLQPAVTPKSRFLALWNHRVAEQIRRNKLFTNRR